MAGNPAPDWYPDPDDPALLRWWDGTRWSGETRVAHHAPGDAAGEFRAAGVPSGDPGAAAGGPGGSHGGAPPHGGGPYAAHGSDPYPAAGDPGAMADPGGGGATGLQASWREPALQSWAATYRSVGPAPGTHAPAPGTHAPAPGTRTPAVRRWVLVGAAVVIVAAVAAWLLLLFG